MSRVGASTGETPNDRGGDGMDRKTVRFEKATVEHVESLMEDGEYASFSAAVRQNLPDDWPTADGSENR